LFAYKQGYTPFDVVTWYGNYKPYKYALERFINSATVDRDQSDPSMYCVLRRGAKSRVFRQPTFWSLRPRGRSHARNTFPLP
jgi:homogentisate 1,2-dioxygenase